MPYELFWHLNPRKLKPFKEAYQKRLEVEEYARWQNGLYVMRAVGACFGGQYPEQPFGMEQEKKGYLDDAEDDEENLTGDLSKEIVVSFTPMDEWGSIAGNGLYYDIGIFSYSDEKHCYDLIGTYPAYNFDSKLKRKNDDRNQYDKNEKFKLEGGLKKYYSEYFAEENWRGTVLVRIEILVAEDESYGNSPHRHRISVYEPIYDINSNKLKWKEIFSKKTDEYMKDCSKDYIKDFLENNYIDIIKWEN